MRLHDLFCVVMIGSGVAGALAGHTGRRLLRQARPPAACGPPWPELAAAALTALLAGRWLTGALPWWWLPVPVLLGWLGAPLVAADLRHRRLPDVLTLPGYPLLAAALVLAALGAEHPGLLLGALFGGLLFGGGHALVRRFAPTALGGGDVKLAGALGLVLGALGWLALPVAATLAALVTVALAVATRARAAPHGPGLLAATWLLAAFPGAGLPG